MKTLSPTLKNLVHILNDGEYHSGASLGKSLAISRNAIWKHINQLEKFEINIESAPRKGYRLTQTLILLDNKSIKKNIRYSGHFAPKKIEVLGSITSTNDYLKTDLTQDSATYFCVAEQQTMGRGRFGRSWHSPFGANVYLSCRWHTASDVSKLNGLNLVIALAVIDALHEYGLPRNLAIKWPNDIYWQGKKLAGILTEINAESQGETRVVIGIGLNVNMPTSAKSKIDRSWTAVADILGSYQDRNKIVGLLISHVARYLEDFDANQFSSFITQWAQYDFLYGRKVALTIGKDTVQGTAVGINEQGHLLLQDANKRIIACSAGEASLHTATFSKT